MPSKDIKKLRAAQNNYKAKHRDAINARKRAAYHANPEKHQERASIYRKENKEQVNSYNQKYSVAFRAQLRSEMIEAYGGKCACCGEAEPMFMQLDHIENDGAAERKIIRTSHHLWGRLRKAGWPKDRHQLLCANCNFGKRLNGGTCPHKLKNQ